MLLDQRDTEIYEFGPFRLETGQRRLLRDGAPVSLTPKAFDLLVLLVRAEGRLLSKTELLDALWPDAAVEEVNLANNVSLLRKTLGDRGYIETVPRFGYRFSGECRALAPVVPEPEPELVIERRTVTRIITHEVEVQPEPAISIEAAPVASDRLLPAAPEPKKGRFLTGLILGMSLAVVVGVGFGWRFWGKKGPTGPRLPLRVIPLTSDPGRETRPAFSPDGKSLAYTWDGPNGDNLDVYVRSLDGGPVRRVTTDPATDSSPIWSPDGKRLAFFRYRKIGLEVVIASLDGGPEHSLGIVTDGISWSPDGKTLAVSDRPTSDQPPRVFTLAVETGFKKQLAFDGGPEFSDGRTRFSPDGKWVAFVRTSPALSELYVVPATGGPTRRVTTNAGRVDSLDWLPDGSGLIFSSSRSGKYQAWEVSLEGGEMVPVSGLEGQCRDVTVSPDGTRLAYQRWETDVNIFRMKISGGDPVRVTTATQTDDSPIVSPDGKRVAFMSNRTGFWEVWGINPDGTDERRITNVHGPPAGSPRWSPDGKRLVFDVHNGQLADIYVISADGGEPTRLTTGAFRDTLPNWSADGKTIFFCSNRSGTPQLWKMPATGGEAVQLTKYGGWEAFVSPTGDRLYYTKGIDILGLWSVSVEGGPETPVGKIQLQPRHRNWAVGKDAIYDIEFMAGKGWVLNRYDLKTGELTPLRVVYRNEVPNPVRLAVTRTEDEIYYAFDERSGGDIVLVENFHSVRQP
jgi:Tol biopolymer transport system component/DNA-binding winged helix-turn-helix (wHTH) protein